MSQTPPEPDQVLPVPLDHLHGRRPVVYTAGPFRASSDYARKLNRDRAEALAFVIWGLGAVALCPHMNTANFDGALADDVWLEGDIELLIRCDAIAMVRGWQHSTGARKELDVAIARGLPVFYQDESAIYGTILQQEPLFSAWVKAWKAARVQPAVVRA